MAKSKDRLVLRALEFAVAELQKAVAARESRPALVWARCAVDAAEKLDAMVAARDRG